MITAESGDLILLQADGISFDEPASRLVATGNGVVTFRGSHLYFTDLVYDIRNDQLDIEKKFKIVSTPNQTIFAQKMHYNIKKKIGQVASLDARIEKAFIRGNSLTVTPNKLLIGQSVFTTCDLPSPHYKIVSKKMEIYPDMGVVASFDNLLFLQGIPLLWLPVYVYGSGSYNPLSSHFADTSIFPRFGSNPREGSFVKGGMSYLLSPASMGSIDLGYMEKNGPYWGISHHHTPDPLHHITGYLHSLGMEGWDGGLVYQWDFLTLPRVSSQADPSTLHPLNLGKFQPSQLGTGQLTFMSRFNELINYSRVDHKAQAELLFHNISVDKDRFVVETTFKVGQIGEKTFENRYIDSFCAQNETTLVSKIDVAGVILIPETHYYGNWYSDRNWQRLMATLKMTFNTFWGNPSLAYSKRLMGSGGSPFEFDQQFAFQHDEVGYSIQGKWGSLECQIFQNFDLETKRFRLSTISISSGIHCWKTIFSWDTLTGQVGLGASLN